MEEKIKSLTDAVNNTTESEKSKKIDTINTALKALALDWKFSVPKKDNPTEQESKTFDGNTNNDEIANIIELLIKDEPDQAKKNQYKSDLTAALQWARDALKTLASESHQIRQAIENETTETSDKLNVLSQILTENAKTTLEIYTNKTNRSEMTSDASYTNYIHGWQIIIATLWASTHLSDTKDNDIDSNTLWPRTRAGIKTIQTHLNSIGVSREDLWCKNNLPDGIPGPKTLQALLKKQGDTTILQKMIEDKKNNSLNLTIIEPEFKKVSSQKDITATSSQSRIDSSWLWNQSAVLKSEQTWEVVEKSALEIKKSAILSNIQKIPWLEKVSDLKTLWITFDNEGKTDFGSSWLARINPDDNKDFSIKLKETYIIKDWKIIENIKNVIKISNKEWKIKSKWESINFTDEGDEYVFKINDITINIDKNDKNSFEKTVKLWKEIIRVIDKVLNSPNELRKFEIDKRNNNTIQADYKSTRLNYWAFSGIIDINLVNNIREEYGVSPEQLKKFLQALYNKKKSKTEKWEVEFTSDNLKKNKFYVESHGEKLAYYIKNNEFYIKTNTGVKLNFKSEEQAKKTWSIINKIISIIKKNWESLDYFETGASNNTLQADYKGRYRDIAILDDIKWKTWIDGEKFIDFMNEYRHDVWI